MREQQQPDVVAQLDAAIDEFCALLTDHFLTTAAFKALEYLIRRFKLVCVNGCGDREQGV